MTPTEKDEFNKLMQEADRVLFENDYERARLMHNRMDRFEADMSESEWARFDRMQNRLMHLHHEEA